MVYQKCFVHVCGCSNTLDTIPASIFCLQYQLEYSILFQFLGKKPFFAIEGQMNLKKKKKCFLY